MWDIYEKKSLLRKVAKIPKAVLKRYEIWKRIVELEGPEGLREIKGLHDEALKGEWRGFRSSRLNKQWRILYKVKQNICEVYVIDINPHDYRRS
jgi:addiction module RelE/StbE family toxin